MFREQSLCLQQRTFLKLWFLFCSSFGSFYITPKSFRRIIYMKSTRASSFSKCRKQNEKKNNVQLDFLHLNPHSKTVYEWTKTMIYKVQTAKIKNQLPKWRPPVLIRNIRNGKECMCVCLCAQWRNHSCVRVCINREKCS